MTDILKPYDKVIDLILEEKKEKEEKYKKNKGLFYLSIDYFLGKYMKKYGRGIGKSGLNKKLAILGLTSLLTRYRYEDLSEEEQELFPEVEIKAKAEKHYKPLFYRAFKLDREKLTKEIEKLKEKGLTIDNCTYENIALLFDVHMAGRCITNRKLHKVSKERHRAIKLAKNLIEVRDIISVAEVKKHLLENDIKKRQSEDVAKLIKVSGYTKVRYTKKYAWLGKGYKPNQRVYIKNHLKKGRDK